MWALPGQQPHTHVSRVESVIYLDTLSITNNPLYLAQGLLAQRRRDLEPPGVTTVKHGEPTQPSLISNFASLSTLLKRRTCRRGGLPMRWSRKPHDPCREQHVREIGLGCGYFGVNLLLDYQAGAREFLPCDRRRCGVANFGRDDDRGTALQVTEGRERRESERRPSYILTGFGDDGS